ncbi:MAG: hypothetical protein SGARI_001698 [Bacillariaceae sp.]
MSLNTGINFDRRAIQAWRSRSDVCPVTGGKLGLLMENNTLKADIAAWKKQVIGYRRVKRGSPTTYYVLDAKQPARKQLASKNLASKALDAVQEEGSSEKAKDEMFSKVNDMLSAFTDAGVSSYIAHVSDTDKEVDWSKPYGPGTTSASSSSSSFTQLSALVEESTKSGIKYNVEYKSVFQQDTKDDDIADIVTTTTSTAAANSVNNSATTISSSATNLGRSV